jgi:hypothetical protein
MWSTVSPAWPGDANGDSIVNGLDIGLIASHWLHTAGGGASVPEPSTWTLLATGAAALLAFRRRKSKAPQPSKITTWAY